MHNTQVHVCLHRHTCAHMDTGTHVCVHAHRDTYTHVCMCTHVCTMLTGTHMHTHTRMHRLIHTHRPMREHAPPAQPPDPLRPGPRRGPAAADSGVRTSHVLQGQTGREESVKKTPAHGQKRAPCDAPPAQAPAGHRTPPGSPGCPCSAFLGDKTSS